MRYENDDEFDDDVEKLEELVGVLVLCNVIFT
jgi:hypothetical protein